MSKELQVSGPPSRSEQVQKGVAPEHFSVSRRGSCQRHGYATSL